MHLLSCVAAHHVTVGCHVSVSIQAFRSLANVMGEGPEPLDWGLQLVVLLFEPHLCPHIEVSFVHPFCKAGLA